MCKIYTKENLTLRAIRKEDCQKISESFRLQGWNKPVTQYEEYFKCQASGSRDVIVAEMNGEFAGYLTIKWT